MHNEGTVALHEGSVLVDADDRDAARRLQGEHRDEGLRPGVVVRQDGTVRDQSETRAPANRPGQTPAPCLSLQAGHGHRAGGASGDQRTSRMGSDDGGAKGAADQHVSKMGWVPAREVHDVGLANGLERGAVSAVPDGPDEHGFNLRAKRAEVIAAHIRPALKGRLPIGRAGRGQDRDARARPGDGGEEVAIDRDHPGEELSGADQRHGSGHDSESSACGADDGRRPTLPR